MNPILIAAAIIPAVILLVRVYKADRLEREPTGLMISLIVFGILSTFIALVLEVVGGKLLGAVVEEDTILFNAIQYFGIVAFSEEGAKYVLLKVRTWKHPAFNCQFDGVVYAVFVSLGFALWENIGYVAQFGLRNALIRAVTAVPGHACFGVFMGVYYGAAKRFEASGNLPSCRRMRKMALLFPAFMHGAYDFIASLKSGLSALLFLGFIIVMFIFAYRIVKRASAEDRFIVQPQNDPSATPVPYPYPYPYNAASPQYVPYGTTPQQNRNPYSVQQPQSFPQQNANVYVYSYNSVPLQFPQDARPTDASAEHTFGHTEMPE